MSIKQIAVFFSAFILVFAFTFFFAEANEPSFTATSTSACAVNLVWTPQLGAKPENFEVRYTTNSNFQGGTTTIRSLIFSSSTRSALITGLIQNTRYLFDIKGLLVNTSTRMRLNTETVTTGVLPSKPGKPQNASGSLDLVGGILQTKINFSVTSTLSSNFSLYGGFLIKRGTKEISSSTLPLINNSYSFVDDSNELSTTTRYIYGIQVFESDLGCGNTRIISDEYVLTIPASPTNVRAFFEFDAGSNEYETIVSWTNGLGSDKTEVYRNDIFLREFDAGITSFEDLTVESGRTYTYAVRGKSNSGGESSLVKSNKIRITNTPENVRVLVTSISSEFANVVLTWDNTRPEDNYIVKYGTSTQNLWGSIEHGAGDGETAILNIDNLPINQNYYFQVEFKGTGIPSEFVMVNTTIKHRLSGQAWSSIGNHGVGWIKFSCDATDPVCRGQRFSVYIDEDGYLHGGAWASVDASGAGYGWLLFEKTHLEGCPQGTCAAKLMEDGTIRGWARFYSTIGGVTGQWDGWVALNSKTIEGGSLSVNSSYLYAQLKGAVKSIADSISFKNIWGIIKYSVLSMFDAVKAFASDNSWGIKINPPLNGVRFVSGQAWGGDVVGWIGFSICNNDLCNVVAEGNEVSRVVIDYERDNLAPREKTKLWVESVEGVDWSKAPVLETGYFSPTSSIATTTFTSPIIGPKEITITASTTAGLATENLKITKNPYKILCTTKNEGVRVDWIKEWTDPLYPSYEPHSLSLTYSTSSPTGPWIALSPNPTISIGSGSYEHDRLSTSTIYYYKLSGRFSNPDQTYDMITTNGCVAGRSVLDNPSRLRVYARDMESLLLNWKDNSTSTENYRFHVERIKLTPASSTEFGVTTSQAFITSQSIPLTWKNITTSTPFYMWIERSSTTNPGIRFGNPNKKDPTYPGCSTENGGDSACAINKSLGVFRPIVVTTTNPKTFTGRTTAFYDNDVVGRNGEATTFFYRIRACSSIKPKYTECSGSECVVNTDYRPTYACSPFTETSTTGSLIATTTPPLPVIQATTTIPVKVTPSDPHTKYKTTIQWKDDSLRETGTVIQRNGLTAVKRGNVISFENIDLATTTLNPDVVRFGGSSTIGGMLSWEDNTLEAGQIYTYKIIPFYETINPITNSFVRVFSLNESTNVGLQTPYRVVVGVSGDGGVNGYVTEETKNLDTRTSRLVGDFEPHEQAVVKYHYKNPEARNIVFFDRWIGGTSQCSTEESCITPRVGTVNATAEFKKYCYNLNVQASPDWCATVSKTGVACSKGSNVGEFNRDQNVTVTYSITSSTCTFSKWQKACSGTGACNVFMNGDQSVTATFLTTSTSTINLDTPNIPLFANIENTLPILKNSIENLFNGENASIQQVKNALNTGQVTSFVASVYSEITSFVNEIKNMVLGIFSASASTPNSDDDYFVQINTSPLSQPSYKDDQLEADTIYYYRVGIKYPNDSTIKKWSLNYGSGKTLPVGSRTLGTKSPVCIRNSYCDFSLPQWMAPIVTGLTIERSEQQCNSNADCVNVGRKIQTTQEQ